MKKTILILALLFSYCISAQTIVQLGGNQKIETFEFNDTSNILTLKLENSGIKTVDLSSLSGGGSGSDNQTITDLSLSGTVLSITIEDGNTQTLDLAPILADGSETKISAGSNVTITGSGTTASPYVINSTGGGGSTTLNNTLTSTATDEAATANVAKVLNDKIEAAIIGAGASASPITKNDWDGVVTTWDTGNTIQDGHQLFAVNVFLVEGEDYTVSGSTITYAVAPLASEVHTFFPNVVVGGGGGSATTDAADLTSGVLADARVQESNVTQHQAALSINASQIPDLPPSGSVDKTANLFLDNSTGSSPQLGVKWTFGGNPYQAHLSGLNGSTYFNWNHNGTSNSLLYSTTGIRPLTTDVLDWGSVSSKFKNGWFSGKVNATGFTLTGANSTDLLTAGGVSIPNTFLSKPTISQYNISRTAAASQANGTVNFFAGADLTYTIDTGTFEVGTRILVNNEGATSVTITAGTDVTINGTAALATGKAAWLVQVTLDEWLIISIN